MRVRIDAINAEGGSKRSKAKAEEAETVEAAAALAADHELFDRMERRMFDSAAQAMGEATERSRTPA